MAKKDLDFDFDGMSLFDFMPDITPTKEEDSKASEKEANVSDNASETNTAVKQADSVDEGDDEDLDSETLDAAEETPAAKKTTSTTTKPAAKKAKGLKGEDKVTLPIACYGRNWSHAIDELGTITYNELVKLLYNEGFKEVAHSQVTMISGSGFVLFTTPTKESDTDILVSIKDGTQVTVADGMLQMSVDVKDFSDLSAEEISVLHLQEKWEQSVPEWRNKGLNFDPVSQIAIPVCDCLINSKDEVPLPATIIVNGEKVALSEEHFLLKEKITAQDILEHLKQEVSAVSDYNFFTVADTALCKYSDNVYVLRFTENKQSKTVTYDRSFAKIGKSEAKKAIELIHLPVDVYFVTLNMTFRMLPEQFGGKTKVKEEEILEILKQSYSILRSKDRRIETVYAKENNLFSVALVSGTKGSAYALPEAPECGLFKLLRSVAEVNEVKKLDSFLGLFCPDNGPAQRLEITPTGIFIGEKGSGRESYLVKNVTWESKLPKIPRVLFDTIVADFTAHSDIERILRIYWDRDNKSYQLVAPLADATTAGRAFIHYRFPSLPQNMQLVLTVHSHNTMPAYFSSTDNADEAVTGIYGVVGTVNTTPTSKFRVGMEGAFSDISFDMLFE